MRKLLTRSLESISQVIPPSLYPRLVQRDVTSIFYHAVSDDALPHVRHLYPVVPVVAFEAALDFLQENFIFVSYNQLHDHFIRRTPLPRRAVHLSFDDGFAECFRVVRPLLLARGLPCTFFLTIDWLDNRMLYFRHLISLCVHATLSLGAAERDEFFAGINHRLGLNVADMAGFTAWITAFREPAAEVFNPLCADLEIDVAGYLREHQPYLTTAQVQQMQHEGFTIGAHGLSHRKLGFIPPTEIEVEIAGSCREIQAITGQAVVPFSFPQSAGNISREQLADIRDRNPDIGLLFDTKDLRRDKDFIVNRVWAERPLTADRRLHTLAEILANAYRDAWVDSAMRFLRRN